MLPRPHTIIIMIYDWMWESTMQLGLGFILQDTNCLRLTS